MDATSILATLALFVFGGLWTQTRCELRHRQRWIRYQAQPQSEPGGPFRVADGPAPTRLVAVQRRAPKTIRRTALWSIYMGQMAVPGGLFGLFGLFFGGLGVVSIPGLILAVRIWRLGYAMLRRDPGAEQEARDLARFAVVLNAVWSVVAVVLLILGGLELAAVTAVLLGYGAVSFAHAAALRRCADLLAEERLRRLEPEPVVDGQAGLVAHAI